MPEKWGQVIAFRADTSAAESAMAGSTNYAILQPNISMTDEPNPYAVDNSNPNPSQIPLPQKPAGLTGFEKFCAVFAFMLAVPLLILGTLGLLFGCKANFTLPPILGVLPALAGWGTIRAVLKSWNG